MHLLSCKETGSFYWKSSRPSLTNGPTLMGLNFKSRPSPMVQEHHPKSTNQQALFCKKYTQHSSLKNPSLSCARDLLLLHIFLDLSICRVLRLSPYTMGDSQYSFSLTTFRYVRDRIPLQYIRISLRFPLLPIPHLRPISHSPFPFCVVTVLLASLSRSSTP